MPWEKQFCESEALERAGAAFWTGGYEATPMSELLDRMGIQKGSFYATFGCKHQILIDSLRAYVQKNMAALGEMVDAPSPRVALEDHLRTVAAQSCGEDRQKGCYLLNMSLELSPRDAEVRDLAREALESHEDCYARVLGAAVSKGEVAADADVRGIARGLIALVLGMRVMSRSTVPPATILTVAAQAIRLLGPTGQKTN
jgi:TetR/AcrR family transcriptional regulator, transcriptional repressor for nem operon